jgi:GTP-binding protein
MLDATQGLEAQDMNLIRLAQTRRKGIVLMVNKWDLIEKDSKTAAEYTKALKEKLAPADYIPIIYTSVMDKKRIFQTLEKAIEVYDNKYKHVPTSALNDKLLPEIAHNPPPAHRGSFIKIKYITQLHGKSPNFAFFCNHPKHIKEGYRRFLENKIRAHFGFEGVPIKLVLKQK